MAEGGWLKLYRELIEKPIWKCTTPEQKAILITILCMANHEEKEWIWQGKKYKCQPGQFVTSLKSIAEKSGTSIKNVRTALKNFEEIYDFLANESTNKNRLITIVNWELYQSNGGKVASKPASDRQASGKQVATNKNYKNDKEVKKDIYIVLFDYWNSKNIIVHRKLTDKIKRKISGTLENYSEEEIKNSIDNYDTILKGDRYYWTYKWTFEDFLQRGIEKFMTDACFENYKTRSDEKQDKSPNNLFLEADI